MARKPLGIKGHIKKICSGVGNFVEYCIEELTTVSYDDVRILPSEWCMNCHKKCDRGYFILGGHNLRFCSEKCYDKVYEQYEAYQATLGKKKCKLPGCDNKCYITNAGSVYDFCSRSHATLHERQFSQGNKIQLCKFPECHKKCFVDSITGKVHDFCDRSHALQYQSKNCKLPGCQMPRFVERDGRVHDFCNRTHAEQFKHCYNLHRHNSPPSKKVNSQGPICFYNRGEPYYEFTNFVMFPVQIDGKRWPTTEHYFQAQKFVGTPYEQAICELSTPREAFDFSRKPEVHCWRRNDWEQVKEDVMKKALLAKFTQHHELRLMLFSTGNRELVEHTSNDRYWGDGGDGSGQNRLGYLLMLVREELRQLQLSAHKLKQSSDDVQIVKVTTKQEMEKAVSSPPVNSKDSEDLIIFNHNQTDDLQSDGVQSDRVQSDGVQPSTEPTQCNNVTRQGFTKEEFSDLDPLGTSQSDNISSPSEGLDSLSNFMQNPSLSSPNNDSSEHDESKPMEEEDSASNSLSTHQPNDAGSIPATGTTSDNVLSTDNDMDLT